MMTLKDNEIILLGYCENGYCEKTGFLTSNVKEAVLEFEEYYKYMIKKYPNQRLRFQNMIIKHKEIFGDWEK